MSTPTDTLTRLQICKTLFDMMSTPIDTLTRLHIRKTLFDMMSTTIDTLSCLQLRKTLFDMMSTPTGYGVDAGMAANAISSLRGNVSAMASNTTPPNYADEGITTVSSLEKQVSLFLAQSTVPKQSLF